MDKNWRANKEPLKQISGNAASADLPSENPLEQGLENELPQQFKQKLTVRDADTHDQGQGQVAQESKANKARKLKLREVKGETQTSKHRASICSDTCVY